MSTPPQALARWRALGAGTLVSLLAACTTPPAPPPVATSQPTPSPQPVQPPVAQVPAPVPTAPAPLSAASHATHEKAYRRDAAAHLYRINSHRIYKGMMPPLLQAVGVMQVELDARGNVRSFSWLRAPRHVPAVMAEIERTVRQAAPYPAPARMGRVVYTETWLWDKSGFFQLDTLTEGQRSKL